MADRIHRETNDIPDRGQEAEQAQTHQDGPVSMIVAPGNNTMEVIPLGENIGVFVRVLPAAQPANLDPDLPSIPLARDLYEEPNASATNSQNTASATTPLPIPDPAIGHRDLTMANLRAIATSSQTSGHEPILRLFRQPGAGRATLEATFNTREDARAFLVQLHVFGTLRPNPSTGAPASPAPTAPTTSLPQHVPQVAPHSSAPMNTTQQAMAYRKFMCRCRPVYPWTWSDPEWTCSLCQEPYMIAADPLTRPEVPYRLPCGHVFGIGCILKWVSPLAEGNNTCPICRKPVLIED